MPSNTAKEKMGVSSKLFTGVLFVLIPALVSSFGGSPQSSAWLQLGRKSYRTVRRNQAKASGSTSSRKGQRQELTCGLQITVRIRGKKSREEDYTNQVRVRLIS